MNREDIRKQFPDATDDQITNLLNIHHTDVNSGKKSAKEELQPELARLKEVEVEHGKLKQSQMTVEEQLAAAKADAEKNAREYRIKTNRLAAEKELSAAGLTEDEYKGWVDSLVTEDEKKTVANIKGLVATIQAKVGVTEKAVRAELLKDTPKPPAGSGANPSPAVTEAQSPKDSVHNKMGSFFDQQTTKG